MKEFIMGYNYWLKEPNGRFDYLGGLISREYYPQEGICKLHFYRIFDEKHTLVVNEVTSKFLYTKEEKERYEKEKIMKEIKTRNDEAFMRDYLLPFRFSITKETRELLKECASPSLDAMRYALSKFSMYELKLYVDFLPTKIVFNKKKGKTTLLFGEAPYDENEDIYTSQISGSDTFDLVKGFDIAYYKYINRELPSDELQKRIEIGYDIKDYFGIVNTEYLFNQGLSRFQVSKLWKFETSKTLTFKIKGIEHKIEIEIKE